MSCCGGMSDAPAGANISTPTHSSSNSMNLAGMNPLSIGLIILAGVGGYMAGTKHKRKKR